tara:strand:+ start:2124 stop:2471 length:348 start_codon:yes stop_codon:yes gene_type:complete
MPRLPVDGKKVIEYRISLSGVERKALDDLVFANTINKVSTPLVALLSDVSAMALLTSFYLSYKYGNPAIELMKDKYDSAEELYKDVRNIIGTVKEVPGNTSDAFFESFFGWRDLL